MDKYSRARSCIFLFEDQRKKVNPLPKFIRQFKRSNSKLLTFTIFPFLFPPHTKFFGVLICLLSILSPLWKPSLSSSPWFHCGNSLSLSQSPSPPPMPFWVCLFLPFTGSVSPGLLAGERQKVNYKELIWAGNYAFSLGGYENRWALRTALR